MDHLDNALSALSHPSRRKMISMLSSKGPVRVTEIAKPFDMSLNAVSKHLKVLEQAGLITRTINGRDHIIAFDPKPLKEIAKWVHSYEEFWSDKLDNLEKFYNNPKKT